MDRGPLFRLRVLSSSANVERIGRLTPYALETIVDAASRLRSGAWLDLAVSPDADADRLAAARQRFERLEARGVHVRVRCDPDIDRLRPTVRFAAA
jgi:hypothetical protein